MPRKRYRKRASSDGSSSSRNSSPSRVSYEGTSAIGSGDDERIDGFSNQYESDSEDETEDAADKLIDCCTRLLLERTVTYLMFCIIMYYVGKLDKNVVKNCKRFGLNPTAPGVHVGRRRDKTLGVWKNREHTYDIKSPGRQ